MTPHSHLRVGTSSWSDPGFIADWYPSGLPARERLPWYAEHFNLVEVNSSFYSVPAQTSVAKWVEQTPRGFVFDLKLHKLLSRHSTELKFLPTSLRKIAQREGAKAVVTPRLERAVVKVFLAAIEPLHDAKKLGGLLLQLTPSFGPKKHSLDELDHLLELLEGYRVAIELRNRGWVEGEGRENTVKHFRKRKVSLVLTDGPPGEHFMIMPTFDAVTDRRLVYLRAHGRNTRGYVSGRSVAERFDYQYSEEELHEIADRAAVLAFKARDTHVLFNNNRSDYAPRAAASFRRIVEKELPLLRKRQAAS